MRSHLLLNALLSSVMGCFLTSAFAAAAEPMDQTDRPTTPPSSVAISGAEVYPTPGESVALQQSVVFDRSRFDAIVGKAAIDELTKAKGINWELLADVGVSYEAAGKRNSILRISKFMQTLFSARFHDKDFSELFGQVLDVSSKVETVPEERMFAHARRYFKEKFPAAEITFKPKMGGDQLGSVVEISQPDGRRIKYYVKTHSGGVKLEHSTAAKPVNAIELMVYKMLEVFGIGCESHFFGRDDLNFYIATRDANELGGFMEYANIKETETELPLVWGVLNDVLVPSAIANEANYAAIEDAIASDVVAQNFLQQVSLLDIFARLMLLTDLQTNGGNYGFVRREDGVLEVKVIDFRLSEIEEIRDRVYTEERFAGLLRGNGYFNYITADTAVCYALRNRPKNLRVAEALRVLDTSLSGWSEKIEHAKALTIDGVMSVGLSGEVKEKLVSDIEGFSAVLLESFAEFERCVREYKGGEAKPE